MSVPASAPRPRADRADPARVVEDALTLLSTGRADMARTVLEPLPGLIRAGRAEAEAEVARLAAEARDLGARVERKRRELAELGTEAASRRREVEEQDRPPRRPTPRQVLAEALASGRVDATRVAGILRIGPGDVQAIAEGRVGLPGSTWRRLLREIGEGRAT